FYLVGNSSQIIEAISKEIFSMEGISGTIKDFLYFQNNNNYTNGKFFSSRTKKMEMEISGEIPVIYSDLYSYIKQDKKFYYNPKVIITSRSENENRLQEVKAELKRELLQGDYKI